jgi:UDP-N-acetylmuramoylalanine--D-glutamate ligase
VEYINDSKSTDENSTWYSLDFMNKPVVWIVGTPDSEIDYELFAGKVDAKVRAIICLGAGDEKLRDAFHQSVDSFTVASSIEECVKIANELSEDGDVVLFSPACNSFDMFRNYKDRGVKFREAVTQL